jgi:Protein of unknown function (DUF3352)
VSDRRGGPERSHPVNEAGDSEGGKTPGEAGDTGDQEKESKWRRSGDDAWFRFVTRLRAIGYWLREKEGIVRRWLKHEADALGYWWSRRSRGAKLRVLAVAGVAVLYLIVKFLPVPGVPCEISAAKECAPSNETIAYVPRNAEIYAHVTINSDSHQSELAGDLRDELPNFTALLQSDTGALAIPAGRPVDLSREVLPWIKDDIALVGVPGPQKSTPEAYIVGVRDEAKANQFLASLSPGGQSKKAPIGEGTITVYAGGLATARYGGQALFGNVLAVRAALDAKAGLAPKLEGSPQDASRSALPDVRLAEVYLSQVGVQRLLAGRPGTASQLGTFVDYGATTGLAVSARAHDDGVEVNMVSDLNPTLERSSPTVFADLPQFEPGLADEAGSNTLGYIGVGDLGPGLSKALATAGASAQGLSGSLRALGQRLQQEAGVNPFQDLLPALGGQAALVAQPTGGVPFASLIVDGVDEKKAGDALASLQQPILRSVGTARQPVPSFTSREVDGVTVHSVQLSPSVNLSYALFDGKLVVSTQPQGIAQVRAGGNNLAGTGAYEAATEPLPDKVSALVFLNLDEVLGLAQEAGLAEDPLFASLSEDISHIQSLGLAVRGSDEELRSELFLAIQHP